MAAQVVLAQIMQTHDVFLRFVTASLFLRGD